MNMLSVSLLYIYIYIFSTQGVNYPIIIFPSYVRWPSFSDVMSTVNEKGDENSDSLVRYV